MPICLEKTVVRIGDLVRVNEQGLRCLEYQSGSTIGVVFSDHHYKDDKDSITWKERVVWVYWPSGPRKGTMPINTRWLEVVHEK